jgi:protein-S-isoprenylcysteine O-methyltransferase Ste14
VKDSGVSDNSIVVLIVFTIVNCFFAWIFSIKAKRPHGIPRFFAFECILLLVILNGSFWFDQPFAWNQLISWILLILSLVFAILGFFLLRVIGKPYGDIENTSKLVTVGLYRFVRHPLYASLLFLGTGILMKNISIITAFLAIINTIALVVTAKREEREMIDKFGDEYRTYIQKTRMFIPFVV